MGGARSGDPDVLEDVVQVGAGQADVMLGHTVGDLAEVAADVGQGRAVPQQPGGKRVPGLMGNAVSAEVEVGEPAAESCVEPGVGQGAATVEIEDAGGEQRQLSALSGSGQPAVAADVVQAELDDLAGSPASDDDGLPHVPQAAVVLVVAVGELLQIGLVRKRTGDFVGEGVAAARRARAADRHGGDEGAVQADSLGAAAVQCAAQQGPAVVEHHAARVLGYLRPFAVQAGLAAEGGAGAFAVA